MTTSQRLKAPLIEALSDSKPDESISVVDAESMAPRSFPNLAVDVTDETPHSEALQHVKKMIVEITLSIHTGDEEEADPDSRVDSWIDQIETVLEDVSRIKGYASNFLQVYSWVYGGSVKGWNESAIEVKFSAEAIASRIEPQPQ